MIAISSIRPHSRSEVYTQNQCRARASWHGVFDRVVYFSPREPELELPGTEWVGTEEYPRIKTLAEFASSQKDIAAIINADIVVTPELRQVARGMLSSFVVAATSRRYDLETGLLNPDDKGRDIFLLKPHAWREVARHISPTCRIGHNEWDSWMIGFLRKRFKKHFAEFTRCRCIFHPKHEERERPHGNEVDISGPFKGYWDGTTDTQIVIHETSGMAS